MDQLIDKVAEKKDVDMDMGHISNCRFCHGLNTHCQLEVLKHLDVYSLLQISKLDTYYKELIAKWIIGKKLINFVVADVDGKTEIIGLFGSLDAVEEFRNTIRKIRVYGYDVILTLLTIIRNFQPNIMTDIELFIGHDDFNPRTSESMSSLPLFTNLQKLHLHSGFDDIRHLMEITHRAPNLQVLEMICIYPLHVDLLWATQTIFTKLQELQGSYGFIRHSMQIAYSAPNLKVLKLNLFNIQEVVLMTKQLNNLRELWLEMNDYNGEAVRSIGKCLSKYCRDLKRFYFKSENRNNIEYPLKSLVSELISLNNVKELKVSIDDQYSSRSVITHCEFEHLIDLQLVKIKIEKRIRKEAFMLQNMVDIVKEAKKLETLTWFNKKISISKRY